MKNKPLIIAFTAPKQTGKTTACRSIVYQRGGEIISFAGPLKDFAAQLFPKEYLNDLKETICPATGVSYREWAIATGDAWRGLNKNIFIDVLAHRCAKVQALAPGRPLILIDDVRFGNEAKWIKSAGGIIVHLSREGIHYKMDHATEQPIDQKFVDHFCSVENVVEFVSRLIDEAKGEQS
jgi:hypothetical protein